MLTVTEALAEVLRHARPLPPRRLPLSECDGLVLAEDILADLDLPPFDKALVDGYAVRAADLDESRRLRVVEEIPAGRVPEHPLGAGEAAAIMTGAPLPRGADAVVMVERTREEGGFVAIDPGEPVRPGMNRLARGREMRAGDVVLKAGTTINPARAGLLASVGRSEVPVVPRPKVAILPTGDELVDAEASPGPGQIRNSNGPMLRALARASGARAETSRIAPDLPESLRMSLAIGLAADVLLITGGVSAGRRDLVPETLSGLGVRQVFHKVRVRPGKPVWFGVGHEPLAAQEAGSSAPDPTPTLVFGLPGNPVGVIVAFLLFVRPALAILSGQAHRPAAPRYYPLAESFAHRGDRPTYHPSRLIEDAGQILVRPLDWAGSADLRAVASADGFAMFPAGDREWPAGEPVQFLPMDGE